MSTKKKLERLKNSTEMKTALALLHTCFRDCKLNGFIKFTYIRDEYEIPFLQRRIEDKRPEFKPDYCREDKF